MQAPQSSDDTFPALVSASKSKSVPDVLTRSTDTCDIAEPTEDEAISLSSDHWADLLVTAESDDEIEIIEPNTKSTKECYECHLCFYRPTTVHLLKKHMLRKHTFINGRYYVCEFCKSRFEEEDSLEEHLTYHFPKKKCLEGSWKPDFGKRWSKTQKAILEDAFRKQEHAEEDIAKKLNVDVEKVQAWFMNRKKHLP